MVIYGLLPSGARKRREPCWNGRRPEGTNLQRFCLLNCSRHWGSETDWLAVLCSVAFRQRKKTLQQETKNSPERRERGPLCQQMSTVSLVFDDHVWLYVLPHPKYAGGHEFLSQIWSAFFRQAEEKEKKINKTPGAAAGCQSLSFWGICRWFLLLDVNPAKLSSRWWCWPLATL